MSHEKARHINLKTIRDYFEFRQLVRSISPNTSINQICENFGIKYDTSENPTQDTKTILATFIDQKFPQTANLQEYQNLIVCRVQKLAKSASSSNFNGALWIGGSFSKGKVNGLRSDIDCYFGLRQDAFATHKNSDQQILNMLEQAEVVIGNKEDITLITEVAVRGQGLVRLDAMTVDGILVDLHFIGETDLKNMHKGSAPHFLYQ